MLTHKVKVKSKKAKGKSLKRQFGFYFLLFSFSFSASCTSKPTDLRTLIPADSLIYLESNDLGAVMKAITDRPVFREAAKTVPDFSMLNGVKLAVAVTGFETKEQPVTDEASVLNFQPHFVAVLETNAWNFQALSFTENQLGEFINKVHGGEVLLETSDKHDGKYFVWKANDGRKAFALVQGSVIFFGNDETAIEKSLAVKRRDADNISKNPKITHGERLAFGYVSPDGVAQLANLLGVKYASEASDEPEVKSALAGLLPKLMRNVVSDATWVAEATDQGIVDKWQIRYPDDAARVFAETFSVDEDTTKNATINNKFLAQFPAETNVVTWYNLKRPDVAWRSVLLVAGKDLDVMDARIWSEFSRLIFAPYGIRDPEMFLSSLGNKYQTSRSVFTADLGEGSDEPLVVAGRGDDKKTIESLLKDLKLTYRSAEDGLWQRWSDSNGDIEVSLEGDAVKIGSRDTLKKLNSLRWGEIDNIPSAMLRTLASRRAPIVTIGRDNKQSRELVSGLASGFSEGTKLETVFLTETSFNRSMIERRTVSDFGFIGWIILQFGKE